MFIYRLHQSKFIYLLANSNYISEIKGFITEQVLREYYVHNVRTKTSQALELKIMINMNIQSQVFLYIMGIGVIAFILMLAGMQ